MIIQSKETKSQASLIDLLGGNNKTSNTKSNDLFSKLLSTFGKQATADEAKVVKSTDFKTIIDPKNTSLKSTDTKNSALKELQALLGGEEKESSLVSKELLGAFTDDQVRTLIHKAKDYLKNEITQKAPEYQKDIATFPKTLMGLVQLAQKLGLEPESIKLSTLISDPKEKASFTTELLSKTLLEAKVLASLPATAAEKTPFEAITQLLGEIKGKEQKSTKTSSTEFTVNPEGDDKSTSQPLKTLLQNMAKNEVLTDSDSKVQTDSHSHELSNTVSGQNEKHSKSHKNINKQEASSPLEATTASSAADVEKTHQPTSVTPKAEGLIALLKGINESTDTKNENPSALKLESDTTKTMHAPKADSIEVKSKEAQQSMRLFASDLKEAVQEYKPPFTRLTMKLNPEKLGEVEVTLVQRGNNVHVNIQSNNTTSVAFLAHNATELKAQLAAQGITNATMNFMSGGENSQHNNAQHQNNQEQRKNAFRTYESFEDLELSDEQITALEIIIPHYA